MAIKSMTGYGRGESTTGGMKVTVELGSVNRKQLDISLSLPKSLSFLESLCYELIHHSVFRGRINAVIKVSGSSGEETKNIKIDRKIAGEYLREIQQASNELRLKPVSDVDFGMILSLPGVLTVEKFADDAETVRPVLVKAMKRAVSELILMRKKEGVELHSDLDRRLNLLVELTDEIRRLAPASMENQKKILRDRISDMGIEYDSDKPEIARQIAVTAERCSIEEEVVRTASHLKQFRSLFRAGKPVGRKMDFLCQELLREINTIGSKINDTVISARVIDFKSELDSIREQVQNVE